MENLYHYSNTKIHELIDVSQEEFCLHKPYGLWLAFNDDWEYYSVNVLEWGRYDYRYKVSIPSDVKILTIHDDNVSYDILESALVQREGIYLFDWSIIVRDFDGIFFDFNKNRNHLFDMMDIFSKKSAVYTMMSMVDIPSIVVWNASKLTVELM